MNLCNLMTGEELFFSTSIYPFRPTMYAKRLHRTLSSVFKTLAVSAVIVICTHAETLSKFLIASFSTPCALHYSVLEVHNGQQIQNIDKESASLEVSCL